MKIKTRLIPLFYAHQFGGVAAGFGGGLYSRILVFYCRFL
jgi:hypothetical protein